MDYDYRDIENVTLHFCRVTVMWLTSGLVYLGSGYPFTINAFSPKEYRT